jgi:tRNA A37 threonylcarbamoyltransferase TsaD
MSIVDDLISNLIDRNVFRLSGALAITLVDGGVSINGTLRSTLRDQKKNKDVLNVNIPVDAHLKVDDIVVPLPSIP